MRPVFNLIESEQENNSQENGEVAFQDFLQQKAQQRKLGRQIARKQAAAGSKKRKSKKPSRRAATTPAIKWLRELICPLVHGEKTTEGVRYSITKERFLERWNGGWALPSISNYRLQDHFAGQGTLYFLGNGKRSTKYSLVMLDIDVLKSKGLGSPAGARDFANHLRSLWPDLYFEVSTNGKGIHGYVLLRKWMWTATEVNSALKRLELWLRAEARKINADIEQVEVKGTCMDWQLNAGKVQSIKYGMLGKLPRESSRFAEWEDTTTLRVEDLMSSRFNVVEPLIAKFPEPKVAVSVRSTSSAGSVSGKIISDEELACIPQYERLYREWIGPVNLKGRKFSVTDHDFAVAMMILRHYKLNPNPDGSLPCRRVEKLWTALFLAGAVERPWNHHRWKAIRDFLSERGHIEWEEHRYEYGMTAQDNNGTAKKGIACKWAITDEFDQTLESVSSVGVYRGEASFVDTQIRKIIPTQGKGQNMRPTPFLLTVEREQKFWSKAYEAFETLYAA